MRFSYDSDREDSLVQHYHRMFQDRVSTRLMGCKCNNGVHIIKNVSEGAMWFFQEMVLGRINPFRGLLYWIVLVMSKDGLGEGTSSFV